MRWIASCTHLIGNGLELLGLGQCRFDAIVLNQLCDQVAEHRLAMGHCPVKAAKVLSVMHAVYVPTGVCECVSEWVEEEKDSKKSDHRANE